MSEHTVSELRKTVGVIEAAKSSREMSELRMSELGWVGGVIEDAKLGGEMSELGQTGGVIETAVLTGLTMSDLRQTEGNAEATKWRDGLTEWNVEATNLETCEQLMSELGRAGGVIEGAKLEREMSELRMSELGQMGGVIEATVRTDLTMGEYAVIRNSLEKEMSEHEISGGQTKSVVEMSERRNLEG